MFNTRVYKSAKHISTELILYLNTEEFHLYYKLYLIQPILINILSANQQCAVQKRFLFIVNYNELIKSDKYEIGYHIYL